MTAPVIQSIQYVDGTTQLYIIWDRAVSATVAQELVGFTFVRNPGSVVISPTFASIDENAMLCTLPTPLGASDTLTVTYNGVTGTVVEAVAPNDPATAFTDQLAVAYYDQPLVRRAQVAANGLNDTVTIFFSEPIGATGGDLLAGFTIEYDDVALDLSGATVSLNDDNTELTIDTGSNAAYNTVVDVAYTGGELYTWPSGAVAAFGFDDILNSSTDGLPNSGYPNSYVTKKELEICNGQVDACLWVWLNPVDQELVKKYGPVTVYTGGTFGITVGNPAGIIIVGGQEQLTDGAVICQTFTDCTNIGYAVDAAKDWQTVVTGRIGIALGTIRSTDQGITLPDDEIEAV